MKARALPMQSDLFNTIASRTVLPAVSRAEAVQLLASLLYEDPDLRVRDASSLKYRNMMSALMDS